MSYTQDQYAELIKVYSPIASSYERRHSRYLEKTYRLGLEILDPMPGERILDAGCGTGAFTFKILERLGGQGEVIGMDITPAMLKIARARLNGEAGIQFVQAPLEEIPFPTAYFDRIACLNVLSYLRDPELASRSLFRVLKSQGHLVLVDLCADHPLHWPCALWRWFQDPAAFKTYTVEELEAILGRCGFEVTERQWWDQSRVCRFMVVKAVPRQE